MALWWIFLVLSISGSQASGEFMVLYSPKSCILSGSSQIIETVKQEIFFAFLGLSVEQGTEWNGLSIVDPFDTPEAVVEVYVDGVSTPGIGFGTKCKVYPIAAIQTEPSTFEAVKHRIIERFPNGTNKFVNIDLSDKKQLASSVLGKISPLKKQNISLQHLRYSDKLNNRFFSELEILKSLTKKVGELKPDNNIDYYFFRFRSLRALSDIHGPDSLEVTEAEKLFGEALQDFSAAFVEAYGGSVVVTVEATHARAQRRSAHKRQRENVPASVATTTNKPDLFSNLTYPPRPIKKREDNTGPQWWDSTLSIPTKSNFGYSHSEKPEPRKRQSVALQRSNKAMVMTNIMTWFVVVFSFALFAIVYAMMDMDPGRDSIIYRMTSIRMKKGSKFT